MLGFGEKTIDMVSLETALKGRNEELITADYHFINGRPLSLKTFQTGSIRYGLLLGCRATYVADAWRIHHSSRLFCWRPYPECYLRRGMFWNDRA